MTLANLGKGRAPIESVVVRNEGQSVLRWQSLTGEALEKDRAIGRDVHKSYRIKRGVCAGRR